MSHEFEVHHLVSQLVALLKLQDVGSVDSYVELLLKNRTPYVTTQVSAGHALSGAKTMLCYLWYNTLQTR